MHRLFLAPEKFDLAAGIAHIDGQDHIHLARVLRARIGMPIVLLDGNGAAYSARIERVDARDSAARIDGAIPQPPEPTTQIHVAQALGKGDKFEQVVQHGTEVGAVSFTPIQAERSVLELSSARLPDRLQRWRAIAKGAAEQSGRQIVPAVYAPARVSEFLRAATDARRCILLLDPSSNASTLRTILERVEGRSSTIALLVGPEGGWSERELAEAAAAGCVSVTLGPRILRTETAALVAVGQILYHFD